MHQTSLNTRSVGERSAFATEREVYMLAVDYDCDGPVTYVKRTLLPTEVSLASFDAISLAYRSDDGKWMTSFEPSEITLLRHDDFYTYVAPRVNRDSPTWRAHGFATFKGHAHLPVNPGI